MINQAVVEAKTTNQVVILKNQLQLQVPPAIRPNQHRVAEPRNQFQAAALLAKKQALSPDVAKDKAALPLVDADLDIWDRHRLGSSG